MAKITTSLGCTTVEKGSDRWLCQSRGINRLFKALRKARGAATPDYHPTKRRTKHRERQNEAWHRTRLNRARIRYENLIWNLCERAAA
jgi:hypothetical protein